MWPACEGTFVTCVNSSDGDGNPSGFNPTQDEPKFCTLGESFELRLTDEQMEFERKNRGGSQQPTRDRVEYGTSFATPVAAALVATILDFVNRHREGTGLNANETYRLQRLRTQSGMLQVLKECCVGSTLAKRNGYYYIAPWFFDLNPSQGIHRILDALKRAR